MSEAGRQDNELCPKCGHRFDIDPTIFVGAFEGTDRVHYEEQEAVCESCNTPLVRDVRDSGAVVGPWRVRP